MIRLLRQYIAILAGVFTVSCGLCSNAATNAPAEAASAVATSTNGASSRTDASAGTASTNKSSQSRSGGSAASQISGTNGPVALTFDSFRLISDRNIFNPNRSGTRSRSSSTNETRRTAQVESVTLGGTMSYEKGSVAFFVSNTSQYRKSTKVGETIAGYAVKTIAPDHVELEKEGAKLELKVGKSLRREDGGAWQLSDKVETPSTTASSASETGSSSEAGAGGNDALQRLLRKREKEMNP